MRIGPHSPIMCVIRGFVLIPQITCQVPLSSFNTSPANVRRCTNGGSMLDQRCRRWTAIDSALGEFFYTSTLWWWMVMITPNSRIHPSHHQPRNVGTLLGQRHRRWTNRDSRLVKSIVEENTLLQIFRISNMFWNGQRVSVVLNRTVHRQN